MKLSEPLHYEVEPLPEGGIAIWRISIDRSKVYSVVEILPLNLDDQLAALRQAMAE